MKTIFLRSTMVGALRLPVFAQGAVTNPNREAYLGKLQERAGTSPVC